MSGIAGIIHFDGAPIEPGLVQKMTSAMAHRGPDARAIALQSNSSLYWIGGIVVSCNYMVDAVRWLPDDEADVHILFINRPIDSAYEDILDEAMAGWLPAPELMEVEGWIHSNGRVALLAGNIADMEKRSILLRQIIPYVAGLFGKVVLHAAAVGTNDGCYAFVGESGVGKSTLANELADLGLNLMADDLSPIEFILNGPILCSASSGSNQFHCTGQNWLTQ